MTPADNPAYLAGLAAVIPPGPYADTDMDCNGFVTPSDNAWLLADLAATLPGPSGLACQPPAFSPTVPGSCPPLP